MHKVFQNKFGKEGNCLQASIASILNTELEFVPDYMNIVDVNSPIWPIRIQQVMLTEGYCVSVVQFDGSEESCRAISELCEDTFGYFVACGENYNGGLHANVWSQSGFAFDPHGDHRDMVCDYTVAYVIHVVDENVAKFIEERGRLFEPNLEK